MKSEQLNKIGIPQGPPMNLAFKAVKILVAEGKRKSDILSILGEVANHPTRYLSDTTFAELAKSLESGRYIPRETPAPYKQWGTNLESESIQQMKNACNLPVSIAGALMPDAHVGYGLPIGGVLATDNAVIPYAVGVDIACRMKMTVLDMPPRELNDNRGIGRLQRAIEKETRFGIGASFKHPRQHPVMDEDWSCTLITKNHKDKAWKQLGTSGSGNHFVEFGLFTVENDTLNLNPGTYLALLSHSGSRGTGAQVAAYYSKLAKKRHPELPRELSHLSWLDMDQEDGQEYWQAMELMGKYAAANHACIHRHIAEHLSADVLLDLENHHNYAWKEDHFGRDVIVHRKGATPAATGVVGIIPGSMASPAYVVRGKGNPESLNSCSHGAGRVMSRKKAMNTLSWKEAKQLLSQRKVTLLSAGLDEVPMVYKNINDVMAAQADLVEILARFQPRLVKMAPHGERPED